MKQTIKVSFITVNYNGFSDTRQLLESLYSSEINVSFEVIVVDNGSEIDEAASIGAMFPDAICLRSDSNLGFAGGNNLGIDVAVGEYLFFINNDTFLESGDLRVLTDMLDSDINVAGVSPKIKFAAYPRNIQFAGYTALSDITLRNSLIGFGMADDERFSRQMVTPYLHGAAMMIKKSVVEKVGKMPEMYFLYYEELDWCEMMTKAGYKLIFEPGFTVFHKESASTGQGSALRTYYLTRNRMLFAYRNRKGMVRLLSIAYALTVVMVRDILRHLIAGRWELLKATLKGNTDYFKL